MMDRIGEQFGNYRLKQLLGRGGFAEVYLGEHIHLQSNAAIKILQSQIPAPFQPHFLKEAKTIAALRHPNILRVLDFGFEGTTPFLVLDYAPIGTLRDRYPTGTTLPMLLALSYAQQIGSALQYAHDLHVIHRDVKPENMLLENEQKALLSDFGIATTVHSTSSTQTGTFMGSFHYMAPERFQGESYPASDQYALGVTIYEWLCGVRPFVGNSLQEIAIKHIMHQPPPLCARVPSIPFQVEQVLLIALAKDPQQRFATVSVFLGALLQASKNAPDLSFSNLLQGHTTVPLTAAPPLQTPTQPARILPQVAPAFNGLSAASDVNREEAYQTLLKKTHPPLSHHSALIVQTPDEQIGDVVHLYKEEYWRQYGQRGVPTTARVKRHNLNGISLAAAVFTDLYPGDYFVCITDENNLASISLQKGTTALMKMPLTTDLKEQMRLQNGQVILFTTVEPQYHQS